MAVSRTGGRMPTSEDSRRGRKPAARWCVAALATLVAALTTVTSAQATFPGANGIIAATITGSVTGLRLDGSEPGVFRSSEGVSRFSWSPDGRRLAGSGDEGVLVGTFGGQPRAVLRIPGSFFRSRVSWSPDGRRLAFGRSVGDEGARVLQVVGSAGGTPATITSAEGAGITVDSDPDWSPRGDRIAFARWRPDGGSALAMVPPSGGPATVLVSAAALGIEEPASSDPIEWPSWAPDGRSLAFMARRGEDIGVYVVGANGGVPRRIATGAYPAWSPDGKLIAFRQGQGVSVVRPDGSGRRVVAADYPGAFLSWQAVKGRPPNVAAVKVVGNTVAWLDPSEARIEREQRRGRILLGGSISSGIAVRFARGPDIIELERSLHRLLPGVKRGRRCVATRTRVKRSRRCSVRKRERPAKARRGPFRLHASRRYTEPFDGTWEGRRLPAGRYRMTFRAIGPTGAGRGKSIDVRSGGSCLARKKKPCRFARVSGGR